MDLARRGVCRFAGWLGIVQEITGISCTVERAFRRRSRYDYDERMGCIRRGYVVKLPTPRMLRELEPAISHRHHSLSL